ncbi:MULTISPECIES: MFS transporter [unclassified Burkholderia]|uniref:MFS transporter n=1 Tax=unclassified Burkholderia TaxID=2613784 RepID=UPI0009EA246E|nr:MULTISPECIES: MFS transporter [unclassified Burkholderia]
MFGLYGVQQGMLGPAMPFVRTELGFDLREVGLHFAAYALGLALIGFPYRWLSACRLPTGIGQIAVLTVVAASSVLALSHALPITLLAAAMMGLSSGLVMATGQAKLGARYRERAAAKLVEAHVVAGLCVLGGALLIGSATSIGLSWRTAPVVVAISAALLAAIPVSTYRRDEPALHVIDASPITHGTGARLPRVLQLSLWALVVLGISAEWGVGFWGAAYMKETVASSASMAATLMSVYFGGTVCGRVASSYLLRTVKPLTLLVAVALGAIATFAVLHVTRDVLITAGLAALLGACLGNFFPLILGTAMRAAPDAGPALSAQASQAVGVALLIAPFLLGMLSEKIGMQSAFATLIVYPVLMVPIMLGLSGFAFARRTVQR